MVFGWGEKDYSESQVKWKNEILERDMGLRVLRKSWMHQKMSISAVKTVEPIKMPIFRADFKCSIICSASKIYYILQLEFGKPETFSQPLISRWQRPDFSPSQSLFCYIFFFLQ